VQDLLMELRDMVRPISQQFYLELALHAATITDLQYLEAPLRRYNNQKAKPEKPLHVRIRIAGRQAALARNLLQDGRINATNEWRLNEQEKRTCRPNSSQAFRFE